MASTNQQDFYKIILTGNPKSTQNSYWHRGNIRIFKKDARQLKEDYVKQVCEQWKKEPLENDLEVFVTLFFGDRKKRDWDNFHKISMDSLSKIVYKDDNQIKKATVVLDYNKENPRIEIIIKELYQKKLEELK